MISLTPFRKLLVAAALVAAPAASFAGVFISVGFAPPALPVYTQPAIPGDGYIWTPGYWAYGSEGYYWVPGVWVQPPTVGVLWTPGYWGFSGGQYIYNAGYWGPHVGFYGGINYGFGYTGVGFAGGYWGGGHFFYNSAVNNIGGATFIHNTYVRNVTVVNNNYNHASFNGGPGGVPYRASAQEQQFSHENHIQPTAMQAQHVQLAQSNRGQYASANGGHPQALAAARPGEFANRGANQQQRITNGVNSGQMTPGETRNVENREQSIQNQARTDRQANGGALNQQQRQQLNQRQNNVSQSINNDNHNANNDAAAAARQQRTPQQVQQNAQRAQTNHAPPAPAARAQEQHPAPAPPKGGGERPRR